MGRTKLPSIQDLHPESTAPEEAPVTALYWYGMLPATGSFKIKKRTREKQSSTNDYFEYVDVNSQMLWEGEFSQWIGKCPWKQSLSVNGHSFDAFTETLMRPVGAAAGLLNRTSWPGAVSEMDPEKFKHVVDQCYKNVIRVERDGFGKDINLNQPKSYTMTPQGEERVITEAYNPRTDTYFAHYVYIVKLDTPPEKSDPSVYYRLAMQWNEFFRTPPQSVAEMYPLAKAEPVKKVEPVKQPFKD